MLSPTPVDDQDDFARGVVDVHDDLFDQRPHESLLGAHVGRWGLPRRLEISRERQQSLARDPRSGGHHSIGEPGLTVV
jgi:hypothetical protein